MQSVASRAWASTIAAGGFSSFAVLESGELWTWGERQPSCEDSPAVSLRPSKRLRRLSFVERLASGARYAVTSQTDLAQCSGSRARRLPLPGMPVTMAAGLGHTLAVLEGGECWSWGSNKCCQLGQAGEEMACRISSASTRSRASVARRFKEESAVPPGRVDLPEEPLSVSAGGFHSLALLIDGQCLAWGCNEYGQLGIPKIAKMTGVPSRVPLPARALAVSAGWDHSIAILEGGGCYAWGDNDHGQLGDGSEESAQRTPVRVKLPVGRRAVAVSGGEWHTLAIVNDGECWTWGRNNYGQLGDGTLENRRKPVRVELPDTVVEIAAGWLHSLVLLANGECWAWGYNQDGRCGTGESSENLLAPERVLLPGKVVGVAVRASHNLAVTADGECWAWGWNGLGQLGDGTASDRSTPIKVPLHLKVHSRHATANRGPSSSRGFPFLNIDVPQIPHYFSKGEIDSAMQVSRFQFPNVRARSG